MKDHTDNEQLLLRADFHEERAGAELLESMPSPTAVVNDLLTTMRARLGLGHQHRHHQPSLDQVRYELYQGEAATRIEALYALEQLDGPLPVAELVDRLFFDENADVRAVAARLLGTRREKAITSWLLSACHDPAWNVRVAVIEALGRRADPSLLKTFIHRLQTDEDRMVRLSALWALDQLGTGAPVTCFVEALQDEDELVQAAAVDALVKRDTVPGFPLLRQQSQQEDELVRDTVIQSLVVLNEQIILRSLLGALNAQDATIRSTARTCLHALGTSSPLQPLIDALEDPDERIRAKAIEALALFSQRQSSQGEVAAIREAAVDALAFFGAEGSLQPLVAALKTREKGIWSVAAEALSKLDQQRPEHTRRDFLSCALQDTDEVIRLTAGEVWQELIEQQERAGTLMTQGPQLLESGQEGPFTHEQEEEETRASLLLHLLQHFLQGKRGSVSDTLLASTDKQAHVLFCTYKSDGHSMHQSILGPLKQSTPIHHFGAALKDQDEILRQVAEEALEKLQPGRWEEVLLISVELPEPESVHVKREGPLQLVFCGLGYRAASSIMLNEEQAPVQSVDHPDEQASKERTTPPLARQLVAAYTERWRSSLCERAHEMTGLKLFYETNEETASERVQPWLMNRTNAIHPPHQYS